jgi:dihydroorotase
MNAHTMRMAMTYASQLGVPIAQHAEDLNLTNHGVMNEGATATRLGLPGIPNISESIIVARDVRLLENTGGHYHLLHVSTAEALEEVRQAKKKGLHVTCEVAPHHFLLNDEAVGDYRTFCKMNPPLRSEKDRLAMLEGLKDGTIDAIATDHAPHDQESKRVPFEKAAFGIVGVETMLSLSLELYHSGLLSLRDLMSKMTWKAADIINIPAGRLKKGAKADLTLMDISMPWTIVGEELSSKSKNTPFDGREVKGRVLRTWVGGRQVFQLTH